MSLGDDVRTLSRGLRSLTKAQQTPATSELLRSESGLGSLEFEAALKEAMSRGFAERTSDEKIIEGPNQKGQPDQAEAEKLPFLSFAPSTQPLWERIWLAVLATVLIGFVIYLVINKETFTRETWKLATVLASILAAAVGAFLTGMLEVRHERPGLAVRGTGAFAALVLVLVVLLLP